MGEKEGLSRDMRVLRYFLAVAREEGISGAADYLHLTQPTLSRQLMDLELELGKQHPSPGAQAGGGPGAGMEKASNFL